MGICHQGSCWLPPFISLSLWNQPHLLSWGMSDLLLLLLAPPRSLSLSGHGLCSSTTPHLAFLSSMNCATEVTSGFLATPAHTCVRGWLIHTRRGFWSHRFTDVMTTFGDQDPSPGGDLGALPLSATQGWLAAFLIILAGPQNQP